MWFHTDKAGVWERNGTDGNGIRQERKGGRILRRTRTRRGTRTQERCQRHPRPTSQTGLILSKYQNRATKHHRCILLSSSPLDKPSPHFHRPDTVVFAPLPPPPRGGLATGVVGDAARTALCMDSSTWGAKEVRREPIWRHTIITSPARRGGISYGISYDPSDGRIPGIRACPSGLSNTRYTRTLPCDGCLSAKVR